jgi:DNA-binding transcriptional regulator YdaS (Cro superfamily)
MAENGLTDGELALTLGVSDELVRLWRHGRRRIPAERVLAIEAATGISRHALRPDIYPPPRKRRPRGAAPDSTPPSPPEAAG